MAILNIELQIDSEVYPELYARLASLSRAPAREEKLRQLAATGLLWELARLHGPALADLVSAWPTVTAGAEDLPPEGGPRGVKLVGTTEEPAAASDTPLSTHLRRERAHVEPSDSERDETAAETALSAAAAPDFVDLALDVPLDGPLEVPLDAPDDAVSARELAPPDVPVLVDEVPPSLLHEVPAVTVAMVVPLHDEAAPIDAPEPDDHRDPAVRRPASRERLKRMRDRGLFQNG